jgi:Low-density lipoprotein receptor repeat class B
MGMIGSTWSTVASRARTILAVAFAAVLVGACSAPIASAANMIFWNDAGAVQIKFANLNGTSVGTQNISPETIGLPEGVAIDAATGKIYWADHSNNTIGFANLSGGGGGTLNTTGATVSAPFGLAIDVQGGRIYWANASGTTHGISFANLNGSGGADLNTGAATVNEPIGVAVDPAAGKIFWANYVGNTISFAFLNGSGGGDLFSSGANVSNPEGVAVDPLTNVIYWANQSASNTALQRISFANLNGTGGGNLMTGTASVMFPSGVALDITGGKIYWGNQGNGAISFALLNNGGGADLVPSATGNTTFPAILKGPTGTGAPTAAGGAFAPTTLSCSQGSWANDVPEAQLYQVPQSFSFAWLKNGSPIAGATSSSFTATSQGSYSCQVTATNFAGSTTQTSAGVNVAATPPPASVSVKASTSGATATLKLTCHGVSIQSCTGSVSLSVHERKRHGAVVGVTARKHKSKTTTHITVGGGSYNLPAGASTTLHITLNKPGKQLLTRFARLPTTATFSSPATGLHSLTFSFAKIQINHQLLIWHVFVHAYTTADSLTIRPIPVGSTVQIICSGGGCPFSRHTAKVHKRAVSVTKIFGKHHLRPGTRVKFTITAPNHIGEVLTYALRALPVIPKPAIRCLAPGSKRSVKCG